jgi:hypothetical protein
MVAFVLGMLWSGKAYAHCYSRWYYPTPQHCRLSNAPTPILHRAEEQSHDWYVEFVLPEDERIKAIDQLRVQLNKD